GRGAVRKPLTSIKNVTADVAREIVLARLDGPFTSIEDFYRRVALDRDVLESIARSGALDALAKDSRTALWEVGVLLRRLAPGPPSEIAGSVAQQLPLVELPALTPQDVPRLPELDERERLSWDYQMHGAARYHPMVLLRRMLTDLEVRTIDTCYRFVGPNSRTKPRGVRDAVMTVAGIATLRQMPPTANGVMFITLEDETGYLQCIVLPEVQAQFRALFRGAALIVRGRLQIHGAWRGIVVERAWQLDDALGGYSGHASAYGGTDRHVITPPSDLAFAPGEATHAESARAGEYARDLMREVEELRQEMIGRRRVEAGRR
ncbi:MAG TPA: OB-fold nucleic acid binding domain-containing protein, partial [Candidatus Kapabacteria bacterium]|nr:OB-fold nucleic acid binding domain-containing protein [Candidatus Kapabacteria bacterium]